MQSQLKVSYMISDLDVKLFIEMSISRLLYPVQKYKIKRNSTLFSAFTQNNWSLIPSGFPRMPGLFTEIAPSRSNIIVSSTSINSCFTAKPTPS